MQDCQIEQPSTKDNNHNRYLKYALIFFLGATSCLWLLPLLGFVFALSSSILLFLLVLLPLLLLVVVLLGFIPMIGAYVFWVLALSGVLIHVACSGHGVVPIGFVA